MRLGRKFATAGTLAGTCAVLAAVSLVNATNASAAVSRHVSANCSNGSAHAHAEAQRTSKNNLYWIDLRNTSGRSGTGVIRVWDGKGTGLGKRIESDRVHLAASGGGASYSWTWFKGTRPHLYPGAKLYFSFDDGPKACSKTIRLR